jgi:thioesterase domain-containing protein
VWTRLNVAVADVDVCEPGSLLKSTSGKLSRTSNRKLWQERREARRQAAAERPRARPVLEPRDLQERQLVWIWEEVLGTSPIGVDDNLFLELGADSVLALRAAAEVQRRLSVSVQPSVLLGAQTVERQAAVLREAASGEVAPLVTLQHRGAGRPLFLVHAAGGWAFPYVSLVRHLGQERPVHAFQAPQLALGGAEEMTIPGMAEKYLAAMREVQPKGPYLLGGWSLGGFVAFEMANQLKAQGEQVAGLVMFDTHPPLPRKDYIIGRSLGMLVRTAIRLALRAPGLGRRLPFVSAVMKQSPVWRFFMAYLLLNPKDIRPLVPFAFPESCDRQRLAGMSIDEAWDYVVQLARASDAPADRVLLLPGLDGPGARRTLSVSRQLEVLNGRYTPRWRYPGDVDILGVRGNAALAGWKPYVQGQLNIHWCDVEKRHVDAHFDMLDDSNVRRFADDLRALLRRADG